MQYISALLAIKQDGTKVTHFNQPPVRSFDEAIAFSNKLLGLKISDPNIATLCRLEGYKIVTCVITDDGSARTGFNVEIYEPGDYPTYLITRGHPQTAVIYTTCPAMTAS